MSIWKRVLCFGCVLLSGLVAMPSNAQEQEEYPMTFPMADVVASYTTDDFQVFTLTLVRPGKVANYFLGYYMTEWNDLRFRLGGGLVTSYSNAGDYGGVLSVQINGTLWGWNWYEFGAVVIQENISAWNAVGATYPITTQWSAGAEVGIAPGYVAVVPMIFYALDEHWTLSGTYIFANTGHGPKLMVIAAF